MYMNLEAISNQIKQCQACRLAQGRTNAVPGMGNVHAKVVFIGEGPGKQEDAKGEPFVGAAGKFLNTMLESIAMSRSDVFITNVVKCRPPGNRDPQEDEISACTSLYLWNQLELINPLLIATLGRHSMYNFLPQATKISLVHGKLMEVVNKHIGKSFNVLPLYHPAAALYNGGLRQTLLDDFKKIPKILKSLEKK